MSEEPRTSKGAVLFFVLALLIWGALVATPFYLKLVQSEERKRDAAVADDVETVRRVVLHLDEDLAAIRDMRAGEEKPDESVFQARITQPKQWLESLKQTSVTLRDTAKRDQDRKIGGKVAGRFKDITDGPVGVKEAYNRALPELIKSQEQKLTEADAAVKRLAATSSHLWADRIQAILLLAKSGLLRNRAEIAAWRATLLRDAAEAQATPLAAMKRAQAAVEARKPTEGLGVVAKQLEANAAGEAELQAAIQRLSSEIKSKEDRIKQLDDEAAQAHAQMAALQVGGRAPSSHQSEYTRISEEARKAESEAAGLSQGSLEGATVRYTDPEGITPVYEGGTELRGVRDVKLRRDQLEVRKKLLEAAKGRLVEQQKAMNETSEKLEAQKAEIGKQMEPVAQQIGELMAEADKFSETAKKAQDEAFKTLASAAKAAKAAANDAKKRASDAANAKNARPLDDRLQRVSSDVDMEASMDCLVAEIAYQSALVHALRIELLRNEAGAKAAIGSATGGETPAAADEEIEKSRTSAVNQLADAHKAYDHAAGLIGKSSAKLPEGQVSGKNYAWQIQVSQSATHLLEAVVLSDKSEEATAARDRAYKLLRDAARGKEQSPLLAPAIETLVHLQRTAR